MAQTMLHEDSISESISRLQLNEANWTCACEDRISQLPSDILISIISRLTLKEATSTCILSTCWRHLHTYVTHLNFPKFRDMIDTQSNYLSMIDHVLDSHRGAQIKELEVDVYSLQCDNCDNFERWFEFAITKKAEKICLRGRYRKKGPILRLPVTYGMKCLKDLYLGNGIKMTDQDFELLVSNCLALECLRIEVSISLKNVSIVGHSKLKHVKLSHAWEVESIVICDAKSLVSLTLYNLSTGCAIQLSNIPKLAKLNFHETRELLTLAELLVKIPSCVRDQLQLLRLSTTFQFYFYKSRIDLDYDELLWVDLVNIKHLELMIETIDYLSYDGPFQHYVCRLIEACGSLEKLVIKFMHQTKEVKYAMCGKCGEVMNIDQLAMCEECREVGIIDQHAMCEGCREVMGLDQLAAATECSGCRCLKFIPGYLERQPGAKLPLKHLEIMGYFGSPWQRRLTLDVINNAKALQKLIVVSCDQVALARARHDFQHTPFVHYDTSSSFSEWTDLHKYEIENNWYSD